MRLLVFFDLPVNTAAQRRAYRLFRKALIKEGYLMVQQSVYAKLVTNEHAAASALSRLKDLSPSNGLVQVLRITERQYVGMETIAGDNVSREEVDTRDEVIVL